MCYSYTCPRFLVFISHVLLVVWRFSESNRSHWVEKETWVAVPGHLNSFTQKCPVSQGVTSGDKVVRKESPRRRVTVPFDLIYYGVVKISLNSCLFFWVSLFFILSFLYRVTLSKSLVLDFVSISTSIYLRGTQLH